MQLPRQLRCMQPLTQRKSDPYGSSQQRQKGMFLSAPFCSGGDLRCEIDNSNSGISHPLQDLTVGKNAIQTRFI